MNLRPLRPERSALAKLSYSPAQKAGSIHRRQDICKSDRKNFFIIARGSAQECVPLLELAYRKN